MPKRIYFHTGGPFHPTAAQSALIAQLLGSNYTVVPCEGTAIFENLESCDLFVAAALHWKGMEQHLDKPDWWPAEAPLCRYQSPNEAQREAFRRYAHSGKPILGFHGGIACYDDWPEYGELLGIKWDWQVSNHGAFREWEITPLNTGHPVIQGLSSFKLVDEVYGNLQITPRMPFTVHAETVVEQMKFPMVITADAGRLPGLGKMAYLANGHNMTTMESEPLRKLIVNTIQWLTN